MHHLGGFLRSARPDSRSFKSSPRRRRGRVADAPLAASLVLSCWFTVNHFLRSEALAEARVAATRAHPRLADVRLVLRRALDHLDTHPRDGEAARLAALSLSRLDYATRAEPLYRLAEGSGMLSVDDHARCALALMRRQGQR